MARSKVMNPASHAPTHSPDPLPERVLTATRVAHHGARVLMEADGREGETAVIVDPADGRRGAPTKPG